MAVSKTERVLALMVFAINQSWTVSQANETSSSLDSTSRHCTWSWEYRDEYGMVPVLQMLIFSKKEKEDLRIQITCRTAGKGLSEEWGPGLLDSKDQKPSDTLHPIVLQIESCLPERHLQILIPGPVEVNSFVKRIFRDPVKNPNKACMLHLVIASLSSLFQSITNISLFQSASPIVLQSVLHSRFS
ncbi:uncharacterized protein LOC143656430 [Tamandua tetradactyla]|uniref:uncharacterized protein LOC143656430 n=1 Tax=Tamandua tetradactyla TaxID=48850 RepID=UPI00405496C0